MIHIYGIVGCIEVFTMSKPIHAVDLGQRTDDACRQLTRYGGSVYNHEVADVIDAVVNLNDDMFHDRHIDLIRSGVEKAKAELEALMVEWEKRVSYWAAEVGSSRGGA
jgi:hypothetical protein